MKLWLHQKNDGLGHMVVITSAIRALYERKAEPVPVKFDSKRLAQLHAEDEAIIQIKRAPAYGPLFNSANYGDGEPNLAAWYWEIVRDNCGCEPPMPDPYVPSCPEPDGLPPRPRIGVVHGSRWLAAYASKKCLPIETRLSMVWDVVGHGYSVVIFGVKRDWDTFWKQIKDVIPSDACLFFDRNLRDAVGALQSCDALIANDTGMAHVAGGSKVPCLVMGPNMPDHWKVPYGPQHVYVSDSDPDAQRERLVEFLRTDREERVDIPECVPA